MQEQGFIAWSKLDLYHGLTCIQPQVTDLVILYSTPIINGSRNRIKSYM